MKPRWLGPYTVHESLGKGVYRLKNRHGTVLKAGVNICRLKLYEVWTFLFMFLVRIWNLPGIVPLEHRGC